MANKPKLNNQPNAFKGSIGVDTRQKHYEPTKKVDFNNKMKEYDPPNKYYNAKFNDDKQKKDAAPKQQQPKPEPKPQPKPQPKQTPPPKPQPKQTPLPKQSKPEPKPEPKQQPQQSPERVRPEPEHEQWAEPVHQQPIAPLAAAAPLAIPIGAGFPPNTSSVGSMSRMCSLFN